MRNKILTTFLALLYLIVGAILYGLLPLPAGNVIAPQHQVVSR